VRVSKDLILFDQSRDLITQEKQTVSVDGVNGPDIVLGSLIEDVAKSVGDTLTSNNMSPEDIMTGLLSGKPNKELKNMMEGIATNVEQNLKSKNISENDLLGSLQNLMGSLPPEMMNLNKTMNNINKKN